MGDGDTTPAHQPARKSAQRLRWFPSTVQDQVTRTRQETRNRHETDQQKLAVVFANPACFWPEGYLYMAFCLKVRGLVPKTGFHGAQNTSDVRADARRWWGLRENATEDPALAIPFLDLFAANDFGPYPMWSGPAKPGRSPARSTTRRNSSPMIDPVPSCPLSPAPCP